MSVGPMIEKLVKQNAKEKGPLGQHEEPTDSESEVGEIWEPDVVQKRSDEFEKKCNCHAELLTSFAHSVSHYQPFMPFLFFLKTLDKAHNWMHKIDHFEQKHPQLPFEYRVIGELMNHLKDATGKERFMILRKLNRLAALDHTFGKKGRVLEEEIKDIAEERNICGNYNGVIGFLKEKGLSAPIELQK
ncbi:hypothetical protein MKX03_009037, partial [Papaver bracteatum]